MKRVHRPGIRVTCQEIKAGVQQSRVPGRPGDQNLEWWRLVLSHIYSSVLSLRKTMATSRKRHLPVRFTGRCGIVGPRYPSCYMSPFWRLEFGGDAKIFGKLVDTCIKTDVLIGRKRKHSSCTWLRIWPCRFKTNFTVRYDTLLKMTRPPRLSQRLKADKVEDRNSGKLAVFLL